MNDEKKNGRRPLPVEEVRRVKEFLERLSGRPAGGERYAEEQTRSIAANLHRLQDVVDEAFAGRLSLMDYLAEVGGRPAGPPGIGAGGQARLAHRGAVTTMALERPAANGAIYCLTEGADGEACVWDLGGMTCLHAAPIGELRISRFCEEPPDQSFVRILDGKAVLVIDRDALGACVRPLPLPINKWRVDSFVTCVVRHPTDADVVITGGHDTVLRAWNFKTRDCIREFQGHFGWIDRIRVTPDGRYLAATARDDSIAVWDCESGEGLWDHDIHRDNAMAFDVASSASWIAYATGVGGNELVVAEARSGRELARLPGHSQLRCVRTLGQTIVTGDATGRIGVVEFDA